MMMENHENSSVLLSGAMNQSHNNITLHQHNQQQLFHLDQQHTMSHHFLPVISNHHHYMEAAGGSSAFYPSAMKFKLGLSEIRTASTNNNNSNGDQDFGTVSDSDAGGGLLVGGSEQYDDGDADDGDDEAVLVPEARHCNDTSLEISHCSWHNPQDSCFKHQHQHQPRFWEPLPPEVSNENSDILDRLDHIEMNHKQCSDSKPRTMVCVYGELEAIYKRSGTIHQTVTARETRNTHLRSEASIEAPGCLKEGKKTTKKNKRKERSSRGELVELFEKLVKQVVDHQENLHAKFAKEVERLDGERREREEAWRSRELMYLEQEVADRVRERALAASREDTIVSYLEKISGGKISLPRFER